MSKLVKAPPGHKLAGLGGFIAPNTECPFYQRCTKGEKTCQFGHRGLEHPVYFSCGLARGFDIGEELEEEWKKEEDRRVLKEFKALTQEAPISEEEVRKALQYLADEEPEDTEDA